MAETNKTGTSTKPDESGIPKSAAQPRVFEREEGPGIVGVELSHVKEYLRDLAEDDQLSADEKSSLRGHYQRREERLHAKLVFFEKKENIKSWEQWLRTLGNPGQDNTQSEAKQQLLKAQKGLLKAQEELRAATARLESLPREPANSSAKEADARKWRLTRKWEAITPDELKPAVEGARHTIEHYGFWQSKQSTERLCYAALHPKDLLENDKRSGGLDPYQRFLIGLLGPQTEQKFLNADHPAPAIFKSYLDVLQSAMKLLTRRGFGLILQIAEAGGSILSSHPVEWTKRQLEILVSAEKSGIRSWIQSVCDPPNLSLAALNNDSIFRGEWRTPRLVHMRPAGNTVYDERSVWTRESLVKGQDILESLANHFTTFLRLELDEVARDAHFQFIKRNGVWPVTWKAEAMMGPGAADPPVATVLEDQAPEVWHTLRERFRALADEEARLTASKGGSLWLCASAEYENQESAVGQWRLSGGMNEYLRRHFEVEATRGGLALDSKFAGEPLTLWLHYLYSYLSEPKSNFLFAARKKDRIITKVIEASAIFCARLETLALKKHRLIPLATPSDKNTGIPTDTLQQSQKDARAETRPEFASREAVIKKVRSPDRYRVLSVPEAGLYFEASQRTIYRWIDKRVLTPGARRGSITIESILALEKRRSRKPRKQ